MIPCALHSYPGLSSVPAPTTQGYEESLKSLKIHIWSSTGWIAKILVSLRSSQLNFLFLRWEIGPEMSCSHFSLFLATAVVAAHDINFTSSQRVSFPPSSSMSPLACFSDGPRSLALTPTVLESRYVSLDRPRFFFPLGAQVSATCGFQFGAMRERS